MPESLPSELVVHVRQLEARLAGLRDYGFRIGEPGFAARMTARREQAARQYAEDQEVCAALNRELTPDLMRRYAAATDEARQDIRALLRECRNVRDSLRTTGEGDAVARTRNWLLLMAMKDGDPIDWRDEILALDRICGQAGPDISDLPGLLREVAVMASDNPRDDLPSFREVLLKRAQRAAGRS